jgi:hypothetical protein
MNGKLVSCGENTVILHHDDGKDDTTHILHEDCAITLNGETAKLTDLLPGDDVGVGDDPAYSLTAVRTEEPPVLSPPPSPKPVATKPPVTRKSPRKR